MAVSIPAGIFNLGAVKLDSQKLANLEGQLLAKKAAKEEALDKYFRDLRGKVNPAGMRGQDLAGWTEKYNEWVANGIKNKDAISKGGVSQQKHLLDYQDLMNDIEYSKSMAKFQDNLGIKKQEGKIDKMDFPVIEKVTKSIYDPEHYKNPETKTPYSWGDFSENIPTWDIGKRKQFVDYATSDFEPRVRINEKKVFDNVGKEWVTTYDLKHSDDDVRAMAERAIAVNSDKSGVKTYNEILKGHGDPSKNIPPTQEFVQLSNAYSKVFKDDIMDTPAKVAAADIILNASNVVKAGKPERVTDREAVAKLNAKYSKDGGDVGRIDLRNYPIVEGKYNVTDLFQGVKVTGLPKGDSWAAKRVLYDPSTNSVTITEYVSRDSEGNLKGEQTRVVPFETFKQNIKSLNPGADFKYVSGLSNAITGGQGSGATPAPPANPNTKRPDLSTFVKK